MYDKMYYLYYVIYTYCISGKEFCKFKILPMPKIPTYMNNFNVQSFQEKKQHAINNSKTVKCVRVSFIKSYLMLSYLVVKMFFYLKRPDISAVCS